MPIEPSDIDPDIYSHYDPQISRYSESKYFNADLMYKPDDNLNSPFQNNMNYWATPNYIASDLPDANGAGLNFRNFAYYNNRTNPEFTVGGEVQDDGSTNLSVLDGSKPRGIKNPVVILTPYFDDLRLLNEGAHTILDGAGSAYNGGLGMNGKVSFMIKVETQWVKDYSDAETLDVEYSDPITVMTGDAQIDVNDTRVWSGWPSGYTTDDYLMGSPIPEEMPQNLEVLYTCGIDHDFHASSVISSGADIPTSSWETSAVQTSWIAHTSVGIGVKPVSVAGTPKGIRAMTIPKNWFEDTDMALSYMSLHEEDSIYYNWFDASQGNDGYWN